VSFRCLIVYCIIHARFSAPEMTYIVSGEALNSIHSLTHARLIPCINTLLSRWFCGDRYKNALLILLYGLETCALTKADIRTLDFVLN